MVRTVRALALYTLESIVIRDGSHTSLVPTKRQVKRCIESAKGGKWLGSIYEQTILMTSAMGVSAILCKRVMV